jgi:uncharacterized protein YllA (UPF0747 family)
LQDEREHIEKVIKSMLEKAVHLNPQLSSSAESRIKRIRKLIEAFEKKLTRAEKLKYEIEIARIYKIKSILFPDGSLQERHDTLISLLTVDKNIIQSLLKAVLPMSKEFYFVF